PLMARLYLDLVDKNLITAKLVFYYGNYKHDAFKEKNLSQSSDLEQEYFCEELLKRYFIVGDKYCYAQDDDAIFNIINGGIDHLNKYMEIYATEKFKAVSIKPPPRMQVSINVSKGFLNLDVDFEYTEELEEILNSYHSKKQYHRLNSGEFITLPNSLEIFDIAKNKVPAFKAMYIDAMLKSDECVKLVRDDTFKKMVRDIKYVADADFPVPAQLDGIIRGYQKQGFVWLKTLASYGFCGILADDMGLGKTLQVIALLLSENLDKPAIIVCPASLMLNWQSEINRFAKTLKSIVIDGNDRQDKINSINNYDIVITSYDLLRRDLNEYLKYEFSFQIIDEAQYIKNFYTKNSESVKAINASHRFALTGTPIENKLSELWSIFDFLMPSYLESYKKFREKYEIPIARDNDKNAQVALKRLISPFVLRRLKKDVLKELPERTEKVLFSVMDKAQRDLYDANLSLVKSDILRLADINGNKISILAMLTRLRQLCCAPSLIYHDYNANNAKLETCMSIIESSIANGHKILLFSQFTSMLKIIAEELDANSISYYMLTGQTPTKERLNMVNSFNEDDTNIFLISLKAGGTGLNLTGADVVIHYDPWWNVSVQNQATDRTHRIGQKNSVSVYKLIAKDTIEEKILRLQQYKANIADMIISEGGVSLGSLTKDDIMEILS
ncbi:MAG: SNF2-related protein, partial [Oscillospiraceae bacterium]